MTTTRTPRRCAAVLAAAALLLGACSSDGSDSADDTRAADDTNEAAATSTTVPAAPDAPDAAPLERYADYETVSYDDASRWVCRPDAEDICDEDLDATVIEADGTTSIEEFTADPDAPIDCFYVYPTISRDKTAYSDWEPSPDEEGFVTLQQAARLASECRVFAPVYRQATLTALIGRIGGTGGAEGEGDPYADVLDSFRTYMATDNDGRGVVLIGHSQGASLLTKLIAEEIDPNDDVREILVGAYLAGSSVAVPEGEVVGGAFKNISMCTAPDEVGCVTTWSTFRTTDLPGPEAFFGRPSGDGNVAACVNPASVDDGEADVELRGYYPTDATASILAAAGAGPGGSWLDGDVEIETPFVSLPGLITGRCLTTDDDFNVLAVTNHPDPGPRADDIGGDLTGWGLHLVDVSIVMGDVVDRVADQSAAYGG